MKIEELSCRSLLSKRIEADTWFHSNHSMNLYRGCQFSCSYCDGMAEHYHVDNFQTNIRVKINAPEILEKELKKILRKRSSTLLDYTDSKTEFKKPIIGISGGVSDSYQQAEEKHQITRRVLKVLLKYELPVFLLTKSSMVVRDIELLKQINEVAFSNVCFSITQMNQELKKKYEPQSSSTSERFEALRILRKEGIKGGVIAMPLIPYLSDSIWNMQLLVEEAKKAGAEFVLFAGMTLKPGRQKTHFLETVRKYNPEKYSLIKEIYYNDNRYGHPESNKIPLNIMAIGHALCRKNGVNPRSIRHKCPEEYEPNHKVLQKLLDMKYWLATFLGEKRSKWDHIHKFAAKVEKGLPDLESIMKRGKLGNILDSMLHSMVTEILQTGSSSYYQQVAVKVDELAQNIYEKPRIQIIES